MTYSKKLNDLVSYYAMILGDVYLTSSTDWSKNLEACQWLEDNDLSFQGKKFRLEDYAQNMPVYNANYEPTGKYQKIITPDLPLLVIPENYLDTQINVILPPGIVSTLIKSTLSKLAGTEMIDNVSVYSKKIVEYNQRLNDYMYRYAKETSSTTLPFRVGEDGIYALSNAYIIEDRSVPAKERPKPTESLLPEEEVIKHNLIGLLSAIVEYEKEPAEYQLTSKPKGFKDIN